MITLFDPSQITEKNASILTYRGRTGVVVDSLHGSVCIGDNPVCNADQGSLSMWILPFEDFGPMPGRTHHALRNPHTQSLVFLSDHPVRRDMDAATFAVVHHTNWHPGMFAKFFKGTIYSGFKAGDLKLIACTGHTDLKARKWSQIVLTWNKKESRAVLYVNGVKQGHSDAQLDAAVSGPSRAEVEMSGPLLYTGGTLWATGEIEFADQEMDAEAVRKHFLKNAVEVDEEEQASMHKRYLAQGLDILPPAGEGWHKKLELSLCAPEDLRAFHPQGGQEAARITEEGMRVTTQHVDRSNDPTAPDPSHVYLWSRKFFHGPMRIRFDFKIKRRGGLALLMAQCSGMQGEDHLADFPFDTNGVMEAVCWQDIRNYHWEFYREMNDVRNDVASHAMLKNPFLKPVDFRVQGPLLDIDRWYSLEFRQDGTRILGGIDGVLMIDGKDDPKDGHGPLLSQGRIALRCMCRTDMVFRNLVVETRPRFGDTDVSWDGI